MRPGQAVAVRAQPDHVQPLQRRAGQVEALTAVVGQQLRHAFVLLRLAEAGPVQPVRRRVDVPVDHLQRLVQPVPVERRAQRGVCGEHLLPGTDQRVGVERPVHGVLMLAEVHVGVAVVAAVQQHAPLQR